MEPEANRGYIFVVLRRERYRLLFNNYIHRIRIFDSGGAVSIDGNRDSELGLCAASILHD